MSQVGFMLDTGRSLLPVCYECGIEYTIGVERYNGIAWDIYSCVECGKKG